jgi:hypothetical protein
LAAIPIQPEATKRPYLYIERREPLVIMDELESFLLHNGWPVPCSPYYVVNHQRLLQLIDRLRESLEDERDERFLKAFSEAFKSSSHH